MRSERVKVFHMNIRSLSENLSELMIYLSQFAFEFDIIVLTETFKISSLGLHAMPGYSMVYNEGNFNRNDGVVAYIKTNIQYKHEIIYFNEINLLQIVTQSTDKKLTITAIYRSPQTCPDTFNSDLYYYLRNIKNSTDYSIVVGDININILGHKEFTEDYLNILHEQEYTSFINDYTRVDKDIKTCIDHVFIKQSSNCSNVITPIIIQNKITDHYPIMLIMDFKYTQRVEKERYKKYINYATLKQDLRRKSWREIYDESDVEVMTKKFTLELSESIELNARQQKIRR